MKVTYVRVTDSSCRFALTEFGFEQAHVRCRYEDSYPKRAKYEQSVPIRWLEKGYVKEVPNA